MTTADPITLPATAPMSVQVPRKLIGRLGSWQLVRQLGDSPWARVYQARPASAPEKTSGSYAIKVLRNERWQDADAIARQRREAWIGTRVSHPNVVPVLSAAVEGPPFYTVMPLLDGRSLRAKLDDGYRPAVPVALWIARQAAEALQAINLQTGMIHADVKPDNMLVGATGHTTIIDFAFAQTPDEASRWHKSEDAEALIGTLNYMAPERVTSRLAADVASDIYSLGVTLYEMLAGCLPLESDDPAQLAELHRSARPLCLSEARPDIPTEVAHLVRRMLVKQPLRRPAGYAQLVEELIRLEIACFEMR